MAEKNSDPKGNWPVPMLLLVTLAGGYLFTQSPLKSFRPFHESLDISSVNIDQQVPARLWQDPLEAVVKYKSKPDQKAEPSYIAPVQIYNEIQAVMSAKASKGTATDAKLTVLISTLDDSPYSEGRETRIRVRYAVGAALDHVCYVPESSESLGVMKWTASKLDSEGNITKDNNGPKTVTLEIPFEWYRKRQVVTCTNAEHYPSKLLVLWIKGSDIERAPLHYLSQLVTTLVPEPEQNTPSSVPIKLLGPWGSDALRGMIRSAMNNGAPISWSRSQVELLSPWATVDPVLLLTSAKPPWINDDISKFPPRFSEVLISLYFKMRGIDWSYSVGSDRYTLALLGEELKRRYVDIRTAKVAVLSEWDTFYGRMLPLEFKATAFCKNFCLSDEDWPTALQDWGPVGSGTHDNHFLHFTYLRGLDGEIAHDERLPAAKSRKLDQDSIYELWKDEKSISSLERPDGPSQYDYVRRLSAQLKLGQPAGDPYVAIGVLGSDPYDKLLILQALRNEFPGAIFFTTDLDARFLHPSQQSWARNLIIASPFGLRLADQLQRDIPPFRDSYQTAAYHALVTSLTIKNGNPVAQEPTKDSLPHRCLQRECVRLFEVGRTQFIDLSETFPAPHPEEEEHPGRGPSDQATILRNTMLGILFACVLMRVLWASTKVALLFGGIGAAILAGLALCWHWASNPLEEPFFWAEGVSIWPTELLRLLAAAMAAYLIVATLRSLKRRKKEIVNKYVKDSNNLEDQFEFPQLWKKHDDDTKGCKLFCRLALSVLVAGALFWVIFSSFELPFLPARGTIGPMVDVAVLFLSVSSLYVLLLLIAYLCIACSALMDDVRTHRFGPLTGWDTNPSMRLPRPILNNWFAVRMTADYTATFTSFAPYPLYVLFLLIVSRNGYFDHWTFPGSLILAYFIMFGLLAFSSMKLWSGGNKLRGEVLASLRESLSTAYAQQDTILAGNIERVIQEVANLKKGVYGTWRDQPVWSTILYPLGGVTILSFLDFMAGR